MSRAWSILLRCDASAAIGFGHVFRSLALARELTDRLGARVSFAMREGPEGVALVAGDGYPVFVDESTGDADGQAWLRESVDKAGADALVLDVRDQLPRRAIEDVRARGVLIATIDDPTDRRLAADLAFYPPVPQIEAFDWSGFTGTRLIGGEWVVLRREFAQTPDRTLRARPTVLVTMGGSDPAGMTLTAIDALGGMESTFDLVIVLGPGCCHRAALDERLARLRRAARVLDRPASIRDVMLGADLAVASFGVTAYELAATATPAVHLCLTDDHARSASLFESRGAAISLGVHTGAEGPRLASEVAALLADPERRASMGRAGRALVDGGGALRVAERIVETLAARGRG